LSLISAFELAEVWPNDPGKPDRAELKYLGASNDFGATGAITNTTLYFAIAAQGNWSMPSAPDVYFKIFLDTNRDGTDDFELSNDALNRQFTGVFNDVFYSRLTRLSDDTVSYPLPLNYFPADVYDTRPFDTNVMILAVPANAIGLTPANPQFHYRVESYTANTLIAASVVHTYTAAVAGLDFSGGLSSTPLWPDLPGTTIPVEFNADAYALNGSGGALLLHHHNAAINRTQTILLIP
jgi:hypothetical protein